MATDPPPDLVLTPLDGPPRTVAQLLTTFHLLLVVVDPYTNESAWILPTAQRVIQTFEQADVRVAFLIAADTPADARQFLGPLAREVLTFVDPEREAIKALGLERLPALVHLDLGGSVVGSTEGWQPLEWRRLCLNLARLMSWTAPAIPTPKDPAPFAGSPV
ncbi:MAG TPA: hypothetical protein VFV35_02865 [Acidimicrobiales bacterium]|nr:hypothetical protein [Acidimicrobiales bacterium]